MILALTSTVLCLGLEGALRIANPQILTLTSIVEPQGGGRPYRLQAGAHAVFHGLRERIEPPVHWTINEQGIRADRPVAPRGSRYRIALHGDSEVFGWALELKDTFGKRMEALDAGVEVLNFGVPGYNATDVADRIDATTSVFEPDLLVYLINANDYDPPMNVSRWMRYSSLYLHARIAIEVLRTRSRQSALGRVDYLVGEVERIVRIAEGEGVPLVVYFVRQKDVTNFLDHPTGARWRSFLEDPGVSTRFTNALRSSRFGISVVVAPAIIHDLPPRDHHLGTRAHELLAEKLCHAISGSDTGCMPRAIHRREVP